MLRDRLFEYSENFDMDLPPKLSTIWAKIDIEKTLKPVNYDELKECFMNSKGFFNPEFKYDEKKIIECCDELQFLAQGLSNILVNIEILEDECQAQAEFVDCLIAARLSETLGMKKFLEAVLKGYPEKASENLEMLYGAPDKKVAKFAESIALRGWNIYEDVESHLTLDALRIRKSIQAAIYGADTVAQSLRTALLHLLKEPIICRYFNDHRGGLEVKIGDYDKVGVVFEDGELTIGVPKNCIVDGEGLLALIAREVDGHFRTLATTETFISMMLGKDSPLTPLALVLAKSSDDSNYAGYARSSYVYVKDLEGMPEPFLPLAVDCARRRDCNFAVTAERIYRYCLKYGLDKTEAREKTWDVTAKAFLGQSNTRKMVKYAFLKDCNELEGYLRISGLAKYEDEYDDEYKYEEKYFYMKNLSTLEPGELQSAYVSGWLDDDDFADKFNGRNDVVIYMAGFF